MAGMARQFSRAFRTSGVFESGFDKHQAKQDMIARGEVLSPQNKAANMPVTGHATMDKILDSTLELVRKAEASEGQYGTSIDNLNPRIYEDMIREKAENGCRTSSLQTYISHYNRAEEARAAFTGTERHDLSHLRDLAREIGNDQPLYESRAFEKPENVIEHMQDSRHQVFATLQEGMCARFNGIQGLTRESFQGTHLDHHTGKEVGIVQLTGKGRDYTNTRVPLEIYNQAKEYLDRHGEIQVSYRDYLNDIKQACDAVNERYTGSHAFRHNGIQRNYGEVTAASGGSAGLKQASEDAGHHRENITLVYLR